MLRVWLLVIGGTVFALGAGQVLPHGAQIAYLTQISDLERVRWDFLQNRKVLVGYNALMLLEVDRHLHQRIGSPLYESMLSDGVSHGLKWSPDGTRIAFISDRNNYQAVYTLDVAARQAQRLTDNNFSTVTAPMWSADGRRLLFSAAVESGHADVYMIDANGQGLRRLTNGGYDDLTPIWRP
jgi:Tol biopolymer transport system component